MEVLKLISYFDGQLTDIIPGNLTGKAEVKALSYALQQGTRLLYEFSQKAAVYARIDDQPEDILDLMAAELRTQYYDETLDIETKRELVKNTLAWNMTAGTPEAVEHLVTTIFGEGSVEEWFEYGGSPYRFRVTTNAVMTPETNKAFVSMLQKVKNTRSHLEAVTIHRNVEQDVFTGVVLQQRYKPPAIVIEKG